MRAADQRIRVDVCQAQRAGPLWANTRTQFPRLEFGQGRLLRVDLVAEDPKVSGVQTAIFIAFSSAGTGSCAANTGIRTWGSTSVILRRILTDLGPARCSAITSGLETRPRICCSTRGNPVDWYPWGEEALGLATKTRQQPILLSVGYSACHWCHVMAHESFEDPEIAALMNQWFVNIKVDRERSARIWIRSTRWLSNSSTRQERRMALDHVPHAR